MPSPPRLITIPLSHFCEKARWALDRAGIEYREEPHLPLVHRLHTTRVGCRSVPVLVVGSQAIRDSHAILQWAAAHGNDGRLYPADESLRARVIEIERYADRELGPHVRRWAYSHLLAAPLLLLHASRAASRNSSDSSPRWWSLLHGRSSVAATPSTQLRAARRSRVLRQQWGKSARGLRMGGAIWWVTASRPRILQSHRLRHRWFTRGGTAARCRPSTRSRRRCVRTSSGFAPIGPAHSFLIYTHGNEAENLQPISWPVSIAA